MPLKTHELKLGIIDLHRLMLTRDTDAIEEYAEKFSKLMEDYVKSAKIVYVAGLVTPDAAVTGTFEGQLE